MFLGVYRGWVMDLNDEYRAVDLPPLKPGKMTCLRCDQIFDSWDIKLNRICLNCKEIAREEDLENGMEEFGILDHFPVMNGKRRRLLKLLYPDFYW